MGNEINEVTQSEVTETTPAESTPEPKGLERLEAPKAAADKAAETPTPPGSADDEPGEGGEAAPAATPAYKARDKFKVMVYGSNEQKEHDVPDWLKSHIKDEATEKEVISLLEKAYGLDQVKASRAAMAADRDSFKQKYSTVEKTISDVRTSYQRGDIDSFLDKLAIPHERMLQWALDKVNYSQLPPDQQRIVDAKTIAERKAWAAEQQTQSMEQQIQDQSRTAKQTLFQAGLARPDVSSFAEQYDTQAGRPGAFAEEVQATGELAWAQSKVDLTPDQAIEQVMKKWGAFIKPAAAVTAPVIPTAAPAAQATVVPAAKPTVIPNVQGRQQSPMKSGPRSLDDLRKLGAAAARA